MKKRNTKKLAKKHGSHNPHKLSIYAKIFVIAVWASVGMITGNIFVNAIKEEPTIPAEVNTQNLQAQTQEINGLKWQVSSATTTKGQEPMNAPDGEKFIVIKLQLMNDSGYQYHFAPVLQTKIIVDNGAEYEMWPTVLENPIIAGSLDAGTSREGERSYLVPDNLKNFAFDFKSYENIDSQQVQLKI